RSQPATLRPSPAALRPYTTLFRSARARRPAGDVRCHDRPPGRHRPAAALLAQLEHPGFDDGERRRVSGDRTAAGERRAATNSGSGLPAPGGASGVRASRQGGTAGEDRGGGERVREFAIVVIHTLQRVNSYDARSTFPALRSAPSTPSPG